MDPNAQPAADAAVATATTDTTAPETATTAAPAIVQQANPSKGDWAGMASSLRETNKRLDAIVAAMAPSRSAAASAPQASADTGSDATAAKLAALEFRLGLKDALSAAGITDRGFSELIEHAATAAKPADLGVFVAKYAGLSPRSAGGSAAVVSPIAPSNTGAPSAAPAQTSLPADPLQWPADVVSKMSVEDYRKARDEFARSSGRNPFQHLRKR